jgi:hypothetical protein
MILKIKSCRKAAKFFDNKQGESYYPFALTMGGISLKAALGLENKYKCRLPGGCSLNHD